MKPRTFPTFFCTLPWYCSWQGLGFTFRITALPLLGLAICFFDTSVLGESGSFLFPQIHSDPFVVPDLQYPCTRGNKYKRSLQNTATIHWGGARANHPHSEGSPQRIIKRIIKKKHTIKQNRRTQRVLTKKKHANQDVFSNAGGIQGADGRW